ncbi:M20/M25/M40 family metallo-hydrolase [Amycolatopsis sp. FU40]|uniref:M20/M25/M40 family metallo-hydrolase n=1 Tax=Amycolatopsis sp. FU40 TaxID=2914159 RepID=UPI001F1BE52D|nr:M20/M25/M40 family metallo-hydrolase [Amycolatopsis sp. FU40]UKD58025.1 M20/M25/M40 family metallo-hydrolase [Amycolatopsis sp. FU40]
MNADTSLAAALTAEPDPPGRRSTPWAALSAVLLVLAAVTGVVAARQSPDPAPADAPATAFSAGRAMAHVDAVAGAPRPTGSARLEKARQYLVAALRGLGLNPQTVTRTACRDQPDAEATCGRVTDLHALIPGAQHGGTVVLVCHYDSNPGGPGAADDGFGVATLLETARALRAGPPQENDVMLLFTDGEEAGLLGSRAALDAGLLPDPAHSVVLNLEARGVSGPAVMFESSASNSAVVSALRDDTADAASLSSLVYGLLGSDTDFSEFRAAGRSGMGFAVVGGSARYDTALDSIANADPSGLQDLGNAILAATRNLAAANLSATVDDGPATYFPVFGRLVVYPEFVDLVAAILALAVLVTALALGRRRRTVRLSAVLAGGGGLAAAVVVAGGLGLALWELILLVRPDYVGFLSGNPFRADLPDVGAAVIAVAVAVVWWLVARRRVEPLETSLAVTAVLAVAGVAAAVLIPGASYLLVWPGLGGAAASLAAVLAPDTRWHALFWALPAAVAVVLVLPVALLLFPVTGLAMVAAPMVLLALLAAAVVAGLAAPRMRRRTVAATAAVLVLAGLALTGTGLARDTVDAAHPKELSMIYGLDADTGQANWLSPYPAAEPFVDHYVGQDSRGWTDRYPLLLAPAYRSGKAAFVSVAAPAVDRLASTPLAEGRVLQLRLHSTRPDATALAVYVDTAATPVVRAEVEGRPVRGGINHDASYGWGWGATFVGGEADLRLTVAGNRPVRLRVLAQTPGLPSAAMDLPMPDTVAGASFPSIQTLAARTVTY